MSTITVEAARSRASFLEALMRAANPHVEVRSPVDRAALTLVAGHALLAGGALLVGTSDSIMWLLPGLVLVGAGMGLGITPLVSTVLAHVEPPRAGAVSGLLSTMQQFGNALGVAVTGLIFFGFASASVATAFELSLAQLCLLLIGVAGLTRLLPG
jgi:MFS family permease